MKTLFLMRHAKSSWNNTNLSDFERPLNERGLRAAPHIGKIMFERQLQPELIVSSPADRAKQTAQLIKETVPTAGEIQFDKRIYEASVPTLLQILSETDEQFESVMLVGHNPGFENLLMILTGELHPMPTAALAVIDLSINNWREINADCGTLRILIRPKDEK